MFQRLAAGLPHLHRVLLAALSAVLLSLAFPDADVGPLAFIAMVPLLRACEGVRPGTGAALGFAFGFLAAFGVFGWMFVLGPFGFRHAIPLAACLGLYPAIFGLVASRQGGALPRELALPAAWALLEWLRGHAGFLALPWATLAQSQHQNLALLQTASVFGEPGVTFLVALANVAIAERIAGRGGCGTFVAAGLLAAAHGLGAAVLLAGDANAPRLAVGVVQPSILYEERQTAWGNAANLDRLEALTRRLDGRARVIAWPETAVKDLNRNPDAAARVTALADALDVAIVAGASESVKFTPTEGAPPEVRLYNSAYLALPKTPLGDPYRKALLVPFGEYVPLEGVVTWPKWLVARGFASQRGEGPRARLRLADGTELGVFICWENLFAGYVAGQVRDGARLLVQLTNDNWFGRTPEPRQHNLASILRAAENRTPLLLASNSGPSLVVDRNGRVLAEIPSLFAQDAAAAEVVLGEGGTPYTRYGDALPAGLLILGIVGCTWFARRKFPAA